MSYYDPKPRAEPLRMPKSIPKEIVPSLIGEPNLVANYLIRNGAGDTLYDYSGEENHGDILGAEWVDGPYGWGLTMDGTQRVDIPDDPSLPDSHYTVMCWGLFDDYTADYVLVGKGAAGASEQYFIGFNSAIPNVQCGARDGGGNWHGIDWAEPSSGEFHFYAFKWDGSTIYGYMDGTPPKASEAMDSTIGRDSTSLMIGARPDSPDQWNLLGDVAWVIIFDTDKPDGFIDRFFERTRGIFGV